MKKLFTFALVLILALGAAAPTLAYTTNIAPAQGVSPYTVDMYLVEYISGDILGGWITMPPSNRGYANNEIVAGVGVLNVPANHDVYGDFYTAVKFTGKNVTFYVQDNKDEEDYFRLHNSLPASSNWLESTNKRDQLIQDPFGHFHNFNTNTMPNQVIQLGNRGSMSWFTNEEADALTHPIFPTRNPFGFGSSDYYNSNIIPVSSSDQTYRFLIFAKVAGDEASLTFSLSRNETWTWGADLFGASSWPNPGPNLGPNIYRVPLKAPTWNQPYVATPTGIFTGDGIFPMDAAYYAGGEFTQNPNLPPPGAVPQNSPTKGIVVTEVLVLSEDLVVYRHNANALGPNRYYLFETGAGKGLGFTWDRDKNNPRFNSARVPAAGLFTPYEHMVRVLGERPGELLASFETKAHGVSSRMWIYPRGHAGTGYRVHVEPSTNELVFIISQLPGAGQKENDQIRFGTAGYSALLNFYKDIIETQLGFSAYNEGNLLKESDWLDLAAAYWDVSATVRIEPWTPYVAVPENIVTDPPKTGEYSMLGFVMIALAGAAARCVKKMA